MKEQVLTKAGLTVYDEEIKQHIQEVVDSIEMPTTVTEATVSGWGFTKNTGTYSKPSTGIPKSDLASAVQTALEKAETALQSFTETDPTVPAWAKQPNKPTYTAKEVGALPSDTVVPTKTSELTNDSGFASDAIIYGKFNTSMTWNDDETVYTETWTYNGDNYKNVCTIVDDTHSTRQLYINNVLQGTWNSVETSNGITTEYVAP